MGGGQGFRANLRLDEGDAEDEVKQDEEEVVRKKRQKVKLQPRPASSVPLFQRLIRKVKGSQARQEGFDDESSDDDVYPEVYGDSTRRSTFHAVDKHVCVFLLCFQ